MCKGIALCLLVSLLVLTFAPMSLHSAHARADPLLVFVASGFPGRDVPFNVLKEAFKGHPALAQGKRLIPVNHPLHSPLRVTFDRVLLGLAPAAVGDFWIAARVRDEGNPPTTAPSPELALRVVAAVPNSITYGTAAMLNPRIKALTVDGKSASQADYPLR